MNFFVGKKCKIGKFCDMKKNEEKNNFFKH